MNIVETQRTRIQALEKRIQDLESASMVPALEKEIAWLEGIIYNPSYNETDIRLLVGNTPRELRMGLTTVLPEQKTYLPAQAKKAYTSEKTASKRLRQLADTGMFSYRTAVDPETGKTHAHLAPLPQLETAPIIHIERAKEGGSTWQDGKRVRRCKDPDCNSSNLIKVTTTEIICGDCGVSQGDPIKVRKQVNSPDDLLEEDHCHSDTDEKTAIMSVLPLVESEEIDGCHSDTDAETREDPQLPSLTVDTVGVVEGLRNLPIWCCHRAKVPYNAKPARDPQKAKSNDSSTWSTYEQAKATYEASKQWKHPYDGIGFMCTGEFTVVDYDHCIENGQIDELVLARIQAIDSYAEVSPSGTGIHQIARGTLPRNIKQPGCEMYDHLRFVTFTGQHLAMTPETIEDRQEQLLALHTEIAPAQVEPKEARPTGDVSTYPGGCSDEEVLRRARGAANSAMFCRLYDDGNITGYASWSEADLALCRMLAYYSDCDEAAMHRLFKLSKLYREKWDRNAGAGVTYGEKTVSKALGEQIAS